MHIKCSLKCLNEFLDLQMEGSGKGERTTCEKLRKMAPSAISVDFQDDGTPTGQCAANFMSYLAVLARDRVPCTIEDWRRVDADLKETLWNEVKVNPKPIFYFRVIFVILFLG